MSSTNELTVYFAAGLFKAAQTHFNMRLSHLLEKYVGRVYLPQRDGFEFSKLATKLAEHFPPEESGTALQTIIYLLDIGVFVYESDVVIANFDEPLDEGVVVEAVWGRMMNKYTIGFRTDVRSPYGSLSEPLRGMHFFPAYQCNRFLWYSVVPQRDSEVSFHEGVLVRKLAEALEQRHERKEMPQIPHLDAIRERAQFLFQNVDDIHGEKGLSTIVRRYLKRKRWLLEIAPAIVPQ